ncbi:MAG TPA: glutathione S-transferase family protein [Nannocystis sp.]|jgi:glutathione S-transferase
MRLYGTLTSPFVRRVRVVALELHVELEFVDTTTPEGQAGLATLSPLRKVPVLEVDGAGVLDSRTISALLLERHGPGDLRSPRASTRWIEDSLIHAVDGALESAIRLFYFIKRDGVDVAPIPYMRTERERVDRTLAWLEGQIHGPWCTAAEGFGLAELALVTTLEWMHFRGMAELATYPNLQAFAAHHAGRPSLVRTRPPV